MKTRKISENVKGEWMMREEGSYEDKGKPENHIYAILARSSKGKVNAANEEEIKTIERSAMGVSDFDGSPKALRYSQKIGDFIKF